MQLETLTISIKTIAAGVLLFLALIILRDRRGDVRGISGAAFLISVAMYVWCSIAHASGAHNAILLPLYAGCFSVPFFFYIFSRSQFEDDFKPGWFHVALLVLIISLGYGRLLNPGWMTRRDDTLHELFRLVMEVGSALISLFLIVSAIVRVYLGRANDLVESRRKFRQVFVLGTGGYAVVVIVVELWLGGSQASGEIDFVHSLLIVALTFFIGQKTVMLTASAFEPAKRGAIQPDPEDKELADRLRHSMEADLLFKEEALSIGRLANRLNCPEYKMRRLINGSLGYRNFNDFLNGYRVEAAARILTEDRQIPILRIAMDLGYGSLAPFNRAFKALKGMTPTEFRKSSVENGAESQ